MLFVFDWDGTIIDSTAKIVSSMQIAAESLQFAPLTAESVTNLIGLGLPETIRHLYPSISDGDLQRLQTRYSEIFVEQDREPCAFFPGVERTLSSLRGRGHLLAVATGKSRRGLNRVLNNLDLENFFDSTRCADETKSKPNPQMLMEILAQLNVESGNAVMVGDTEFDMEMAVNAKIKRIAVTYGAHSQERLAAHSPSLCVDSFPDILDWPPSKHRGE